MGKYSELFQINPDPFSQQATQVKPIPVRICLFRNVKNAPELRQLLMSGQLDCAIIRAELVLEVFQILAAVNRAVSAMQRNKLSTKTVNTEVVYSLSPTKNISESLATFGINEESENMLVVVVDDRKGDKMSQVAKKIQGSPTQLSLLSSTSNYDLVKKIYHVKDPELNKGTIMDAIVTRIVAKDFVA